MKTTHTLLCAAILLPASFASAAVRIWTGASLFNRWTSPPNWSPQGTPQDGEALVFPASAGWKQNLCDLSTFVEIRQITLQGAYRFNDDTGLYGHLAVSGGITAEPLAGTSVIDRYVRFTADAVIQCGAFSAVELKRHLWLGGRTVTVTGGGTVSLTGQRETYGYLQKTGSGELVINGSGVTGQTVIATVSGGTLRVEGIQQELSVGVMAGGRLAGNGTAETIVGYGGVIAPGGSVAGTLTGEYTRLESSQLHPQRTVLEIGIHGTEALGKVDRLVMNEGTILGAELRVELAAGFIPALGDVFMPVEKLGSSPCGTFEGLPQGATLNSGGRTFLISYTGGDGNDFTLTVVPPPAQISRYRILSDGTQRIEATGEPGRTYHFQSSTDLTRWTTLESVNAAPVTGRILCEDLPSHTTRRTFYRLLTGSLP